jgi:translation initiation factor 1
MRKFGDGRLSPSPQPQPEFYELYNLAMHPNRVVYDTARGRTDLCSYCKRRLEACVCPHNRQVQGASRPAGNNGPVRVWRDRKGRRGKTVTVINGLPDDDHTLEETASMLKRLCGSGGTVSQGNVEVQGDHRDKVAAKLSELGYRVKLAGG